MKIKKEGKKKGKKEKVVGVKSGVNKSHALPRDGGTVGMIWTPSWKPLFGPRTPPYAPTHSLTRVLHASATFDNIIFN